jgi:hypothetical protein
MLSRWRMQEQHSGALGRGHIQLVFPSSQARRRARAAHRGREVGLLFPRVENLETIPPSLAEPPLRSALEAARMATFTARSGTHISELKLPSRTAAARSRSPARGLKKGREKGAGKGARKGAMKRSDRASRALCEVPRHRAQPGPPRELDRLSTAELDAPSPASQTRACS